LAGEANWWLPSIRRRRGETDATQSTALLG
jgi:hypothetical protein